jgi:hypothetical protein
VNYTQAYKHLRALGYRPDDIREALDAAETGAGELGQLRIIFSSINGFVIKEK